MSITRKVCMPSLVLVSLLRWNDDVQTRTLEMVDISSSAPNSMDKVNIEPQRPLLAG